MSCVYLGGRIAFLAAPFCYLISCLWWSQPVHEDEGKQAFTVSNQPPYLQLRHTCCCTLHWFCNCFSWPLVGVWHIDHVPGL